MQWYQQILQQQLHLQTLTLSHPFFEADSLADDKDGADALFADSLNDAADTGADVGTLSASSLIASTLQAPANEFNRIRARLRGLRRRLRIRLAALGRGGRRIRLVRARIATLLPQIATARTNLATARTNFRTALAALQADPTNATLRTALRNARNALRAARLALRRLLARLRRLRALLRRLRSLGGNPALRRRLRRLIRLITQILRLLATAASV